VELKNLKTISSKAYVYRGMTSKAYLSFDHKVLRVNEPGTDKERKATKLTVEFNILDQHNVRFKPRDSRA
jgi:hypothetical protein